MTHSKTFRVVADRELSLRGVQGAGQEDYARQRLGKNVLGFGRQAISTLFSEESQFYRAFESIGGGNNIACHTPHYCKFRRKLRD